jgi:hypothetical protein
MGEKMKINCKRWNPMIVSFSAEGVCTLSLYHESDAILSLSGDGGGVYSI